MTSEILEIGQVGSLPKDEWRIKAIAGTPIADQDIQEAAEWGQRFGIDSAPLLSILQASRDHPDIRLNRQDRRTVRNFAALYAVRLQEHAGLEVVWDGEESRIEMFEESIKKSKGFEFRGHVQAFGERSYHKAACVAPPSIDKPWHVDELLRLREMTDKEITVPITGAHTIVLWSFDEYYDTYSGLGVTNEIEKKQAREEFATAVVTGLIRPNIQALIDNGATRIQIDEPAALQGRSEVALFVKNFNESVKGFEGVKFSLHICFSDYTLLFPEILKLENCALISLELANRDSTELGTEDEDRPGYSILKMFRDYNVQIPLGLGVIDIHSDFIESPELVCDRILYAVKVLGDVRLVNPFTDCGLRTRKLAIASQKLTNLVAGTLLAKQKIAALEAVLTDHFGLVK